MNSRNVNCPGLMYSPDSISFIEKDGVTRKVPFLDIMKVSYE